MLIFNSNTFMSLKIYRKGCKLRTNCHCFSPMRLVRFPGQLQYQVLSEQLATSALYWSMGTGMLLPSNSKTYVPLKIYRKGCKLSNNCHCFSRMRLVRFPGQLQYQVLSEQLATSALHYKNGNASTILTFNSKTYVALKIYRKECKLPTNCHGFCPTRFIRFPGQLQYQVE